MLLESYMFVGYRSCWHRYRIVLSCYPVMLTREIPQMLSSRQKHGNAGSTLIDLPDLTLAIGRSTARSRRPDDTLN